MNKCIVVWILIYANVSMLGIVKNEDACVIIFTVAWILNLLIGAFGVSVLMNNK
jgi:hypothetical protein